MDLDIHLSARSARDDSESETSTAPPETVLHIAPLSPRQAEIVLRFLFTGITEAEAWPDVNSLPVRLLT